MNNVFKMVSICLLKNLPTSNYRILKVVCHLNDKHPVFNTKLFLTAYYFFFVGTNCQQGTLVQWKFFFPFVG